MQCECHSQRCWVAAVAERAGQTDGGHLDRLSMAVHVLGAAVTQWWEHPAEGWWEGSDGTEQVGSVAGSRALSQHSCLPLHCEPRGGYSAAIHFWQVQIPVQAKVQFCLPVFRFFAVFLSAHVHGVSHPRPIQQHFLHHILFVLLCFTWLLCFPSRIRSV